MPDLFLTVQQPVKDAFEAERFYGSIAIRTTLAIG